MQKIQSVRSAIVSLEERDEIHVNFSSDKTGLTHASGRFDSELDKNTHEQQLQEQNPSIHPNSIDFKVMMEILEIPSVTFVTVRPMHLRITTAPKIDEQTTAIIISLVADKVDAIFSQFSVKIGQTRVPALS